MGGNAYGPPVGLPFSIVVVTGVLALADADEA
jgi:hypothetical protein